MQRFFQFLARWIKVARPGFWPTQLWFFLLPFAQKEMFSRWEFWAGCVYVCFPLGALLYGWNDLFDAETDRLNTRKDSYLFGAQLNDSHLKQVPLFLVCTQLPFVILFTWVAGAKMLLWFAAMLIANALYNGVGLGAPRWWDTQSRGRFPGWGWKNWPILDLLNQVGYLLVFLLASWLLAVPHLSTPAIIFSALFAMLCHLFGQLMDIEEDRAAGRRTTASVIGVRGGKLLLVAMMGLASAIGFLSFSGPWVGGFMAIGAVVFLLDAVLGFKGEQYPPLFSKAFFIGWNVVVVATMWVVWQYDVFVVSG